MTKIIPAILAITEEEFIAKLENHSVRALTNTWQIDILDGSRFNRSSFADANVLRNFSTLPNLDLHFMVANPLSLIDKWIQSPSVIGAVVHADIDMLKETIHSIASKGLRAGVAIEIDTPLDILASIEDNLGMILVMGVPPGASGQAFLGEKVFEKIRTLQHKYPHIPIGVDGGITLEIAKKLTNIGVAELCIGSGIWAQAYPDDALRAFQKIT